VEQTRLRAAAVFRLEHGPWISPDHHRPDQPAAIKTAITAFSADHDTARTMRATSAALHEKCGRADLLANLTEEISRLAGYLGIALSEEALSSIAQAVSFSSVKQNATMMGPMPVEAAQNTWQQGLDTFFFKGTNGRWKEVLTEAELVMYEQAKARVLAPDCARWLEQGRMV
jgi:hypothetical protein